jgi:hypothetical protein
MAKVSMIILRDMRSKLFFLKVEEKAAIPGVIRGDVEEVFIGKIHVDR